MRHTSRKSSFSVAAAVGHNHHAVGVDVAKHCVEDVAFVGEVGVEAGEPEVPVSGYLMARLKLLKRWECSGNWR